MELNAEYKLTEVGMIPKDWNVVELKNCLISPPSYGINAPATPFDSRFPTYLRITDITEDGHFSDLSKVSVNHPLALSYTLDSGDIVFARTGASVGKSYLYNPRDGELVFAGFLIRVRPNSERLASIFLRFYLQTNTYRKWVRVNSMRSGQPGINGREYSSLPLPVPPTITEQNAIAEALSDADLLIETLEKLIEKKRQIKQGAMQELLIGKKRLAGFNDKWLEKEIWEVVQTPVTDGPHMTPVFVVEGIPFLSVNNIVNNQIDTTDLRFISKFDDDVFARKCKPQKGDILLGKAASVGKVALVDIDWDFNIWSPIALIRLKPQHSPKFVYYQLQSEYVIKQITLLTNASSQGNIGMGDIEKIKLKLPEPVEQIEIAKIFVEMDLELTELEAKLNKARQIKQGMMQVLLTGRIRLV